MMNVQDSAQTPLKYEAGPSTVEKT